MAGIAGMITEGKNSDFIRIFMVATVEVRIFLALLSPSYEKFVVTLRMATLSKILIMCVGILLPLYYPIAIAMPVCLWRKGGEI